MFGVDRVDRLVADGFGVNGQRHRPLRFVLIVAEAVGEICGDRIGHLAERRDGDVFLPALLDRIDTTFGEPPTVESLLSSLSEADLGIRAKSHLVRLAGQHVAQDPLLRAARRDGQLKPATVAILARLCGLDLARRQLGHVLRPQISLQVAMR